ncbi:hypothetical protein O3G_MSEX014834 [Manduca sexta]|uniref:Esterase n=1 Tax=Manduca sexta TaxID=7130 RepID=A0A921ZVS9_MANSE|nr:hypothetical protein O3G_MSEX014834 [Manduca sexta]UXP71925.1 esterase [Manduca sexta]
MKNLLVFLVVAVVGAACFDLFDTENLIKSEGYHTETHYVTTSDGYILQVNRIPYRRHERSSHKHNRPVVFLMHGLLAASNSYVLLGHENSLAFNLADAGFDVWMGNARGNRNSRAHVSLNPDHARQKFDFFDFSWEEIGMIDVPEMIDYALKHTGREKLHYIGHSQGGTAFLVMSSMRPEYNEKLESVHLLAGVGYMKHFPNSQMSGLAALSDVIYNFALTIGMVELFPPSSDSRSVGRSADSCTGNLGYNYMCDLTGVDQIVVCFYCVFLATSFVYFYDRKNGRFKLTFNVM